MLKSDRIAGQVYWITVLNNYLSGCLLSSTLSNGRFDSVANLNCDAESSEFYDWANLRIFYEESV